MGRNVVVESEEWGHDVGRRGCRRQSSRKEWSPFCVDGWEWRGVRGGDRWGRGMTCRVVWKEKSAIRECEGTSVRVAERWGG